MSAVQVNLILPCYNPPVGWEQTVLHAMQDLQKDIPVAVGLVLVNDGSTKGVNEAQIEKLRQFLPHFKYLYRSKNFGKGYTLREGVQASEAPIIIYTDIDFPYTHKSLLALYKTLQSGVDVAVGSRDERYYSKVPPIRKFISQVLKQMNRSLLNLPVNDTQCGLKGFNRKGREVFLRTTIDRYLFDLEFIYHCRKGINIQPVSVQLKDGVVFSRVGLKVLLGEAFNFLKIFFRSST